MQTAHALYSVAEIRAIEHAALAALPEFTLMQRAGAAAAGFALEILGAAAPAQPVLVLAGPGNNGGDALQAAALLADAGVAVSIVQFGNDELRSADGRRALAEANARNLAILPPEAFAQTVVSRQWALVIDGLFGIGLARAIAEPQRAAIAAINVLPCPILALDVPSGLDADTGNIVGDAGIAVRATHTITFIGDKPGLHTCDGRDYAGAVRVASLDIAADLFPPPSAQLNACALFDDRLLPRRQNSHKGSYGDVLVVGGAPGMSGAVILAARAAAKCGAGRVFAAFLGEPPAYDSAQPELMCRRAAEVDLDSGTLVVGPGLGRSDAAHVLLQRALAAPSPLLLDADALNLVAAEPALQRALASRPTPALLTPHPLEAARLLGADAARVQSDRIGAARSIASRLRAVVVLKGSGTVIAQPSGAIAINPTGNPALATAGTGDVLAGVGGALLAQSWAPWEAALGATWLHGRAADLLVSDGIGPVGLVAGELIPCIRRELNRLIALRSQRPSHDGKRT